MAENVRLIYTTMVFLGISALLLGQATYADASTVGGGQQQVTSEACLEQNSTGENLECTIEQASQISGIVDTSSDLQGVSWILLTPLASVIAYIVITQILIPIAQAIIPG